MALFYERTETQETVRIVLKFTPAYYLFIFIALGGLFLASPVFNDFCCTSTAMVLSVIPLVVYYLDTRRAYAEINQAREAGRATITGSKWSFSNPPTIVINKQTPPSE